MSGTEETFHLTEADVQKAESKASKAHKGDVPAGSDAAMMQVSTSLPAALQVSLLQSTFK